VPSEAIADTLIMFAFADDSEGEHFTQAKGRPRMDLAIVEVDVADALDVRRVAKIIVVGESFAGGWLRARRIEFACRLRFRPGNRRPWILNSLAEGYLD